MRVRLFAPFSPFTFNLIYILTLSKHQKDLHFRNKMLNFYFLLKLCFMQSNRTKVYLYLK
jgi:hypothetical protein